MGRESRHLAAAAACLIAGGCDRVWGLSRADAAPIDAAPCTSGTFEARVPLDEAPAGALDPQLRGDLLELFFTSDSMGYDLWHMTRASVAEPFGNLEAMRTVNTGNNETDPTITADGLDLLFKSDYPIGSGPFYVWEATRPTVHDVFGAPHRAMGLEALPMNGIDIAPDGLTIYLDDGARLASRSRASRDAGFGMSTDLGSQASFPSIGADETEIFFNAGGVSRRIRAALGNPFGVQDSIDVMGTDPDLAADGRTLIFELGNGLATRTRSCP